MHPSQYLVTAIPPDPLIALSNKTISVQLGTHDNDKPIQSRNMSNSFFNMWLGFQSCGSNFHRLITHWLKKSFLNLLILRCQPWFWTLNIGKPNRCLVQRILVFYEILLIRECGPNLPNLSSFRDYSSKPSKARIYFLWDKITYKLQVGSH